METSNIEWCIDNCHSYNPYAPAKAELAAMQARIEELEKFDRELLYLLNRAHYDMKTDEARIDSVIQKLSDTVKKRSEKKEE